MMLYPDAYVMEELGFALIGLLTSSVPSVVFAVATYVMTSMSLYALAKRRGIGGAWLSWVPGLNVWIWGSLSDQYRYVVKGQYRSKRKSLLILKLLQLILSTALTVLAVFMVWELADSGFYRMNEDLLMEMVMGPAVIALLMALPIAGISIAAVVIRYVALYDIYASMDPGNSVLFLVLSIFFRVTEPFFLVFNRHKDGGMPPRRREPVYSFQPESRQTPYEAPAAEPEGPKDYL